MDKFRCLMLFQCLFLCVLGIAFPQEGETIKYIGVTTLKDAFAKGKTIEAIALVKNATDMYMHKDRRGTPMYYSKQVRTDICSDKKCRMLHIVVYWNITGRYLGFELPEEEFLSKSDHEPFSKDEYERLNELLANPDLPFLGISFEKLVASSKPELDELQVDAISGATTKNVADIVVKGAAYTTYSLWNMVYGPMMERISEYTEEQLDTTTIAPYLEKPNNV